MSAQYDTLGNGFVVGQVVKGFGLHNAGRYYTVLAMRGVDRLQLQEHLTGRCFWVANTWYNVVEDA